MNAALLARVREHIALQPSRFSAAHWGWASNAGAVIRQGEAPQKFCCCIAGHALLLSGRFSERELICQSGVVNEDGYLWQMAASVLELTPEESSRLFFPSQWPSPFKERYYLGSRLEEARVSAEYIDHFLEEKTQRASLASLSLP